MPMMRKYIQLIEQATKYFKPDVIWLHGGPKYLEGGHFERNMRNGRDMGGIFLVEESIAGLQLARNYALGRFLGKESGIYRCRVSLLENSVLDFTNKNHRERLKSKLTQKQYQEILRISGDGHLHWIQLQSGQKIIEQAVISAGFGAMIIFERRRKNDNDVSLCVFNPANIHIVDYLSTDEADEMLNNS